MSHINNSVPTTAIDYEKHESAEVSLIIMDLLNLYVTDMRFRNAIKENEYNNIIMTHITDVSMTDITLYVKLI